MSKKNTLLELLPKHSGRDVQGHISVRHQGGREKRFYRVIDWKRDKEGVVGTVRGIEYDPNRTANVALIHYEDGDKRYILAPVGLKAGQKVISARDADMNPGNCLPLGSMPIGTEVHNIEIRPGKGGQIARSAGTVAVVLAKEAGVIHLKMPSGEVRLFKAECRATIGQLGNADWQNQIIGTAGRARHMGIRPRVRGVAQHPGSHPHGGGEGRSGIGMPSPKSPWGKKTLGLRTRKRTKYSDSVIVKRRK